MTVIVTAVVCAGAGYFMGYYSQQPQPAAKLAASRIAAYGIAAAGGIVVGILGWQSPSGSLALMGFILVLGVAVLGALRLPARLTERHVTTIGIVATVLAFVTQFIPPMLDLLNIPIR